MSELKTIAIVGRTNVGKSTLFNRLVGKKQAIVHDMPGVTRDRKEGTATLSDIMFRVIDTAGLETETSLSKAMWAQTQKAIDEADIVLTAVDSLFGAGNNMENIRIFLSGGMSGLTLSEQLSWRNQVKNATFREIFPSRF